MVKDLDTGGAQVPGRPENGRDCAPTAGETDPFLFGGEHSGRIKGLNPGKHLGVQSLGDGLGVEVREIRAGDQDCRLLGQDGGQRVAYCLNDLR